MYDIFVFENDVPSLIFSCHDYKLEQKLLSDSKAYFYDEGKNVIMDFDYFKFENKLNGSLYFYVKSL